ncbi:MAG: ribosome silencing factor [Actinobacteria bacterium]|nr:ribosome silencing factor [Actinomycetota bacterium]
MGELLIITDFFVIASGNSDRQVRTIYESIEERLRSRGAKPIGVEGEREAKWIVLDYASVVIHIFLTEQREYYQLERLWRDAPRIDWEEPGA